MAKKKRLNKVVFLDRDGVINQDSAQYIKSLEEFVFIPGALSAIRKLHCYGYSIYVISNQSGLARKYLNEGDLTEIHSFLKKSAEKAGGRINGIYFCRHHPDEGCRCRKPSPGLIERAARENNLEVSSSVMIGDKWTDLRCAELAGCKRAYLVLTGIGKPPSDNQLKMLKPFRGIAKTLFHAVDLLIDDEKAEK